MKKKPRLTVGCRARILTLKEKPTRKGPGFFMNESSWRKEYGGREVLLVERSHSSFSVMLLGKGVKKLKKEDGNTIDGGMAWVPEDDMVQINRDFEANLDFIDWYQEHKEDFCGDCGIWRPGNNGMDDDGGCPNKDCPGNHLEDYEDDDEEETL